MIAMAKKFVWRKLGALWVIVAVMANLSVTIEAKRYAITECIFAALGLWSDMVTLHAYTGEFVAKATAAPARQHCFDFNLWRKHLV